MLEAVRGSAFGRDAALSFGLNLWAALIGLITALLLAALIGPEGYGIYAVAMVYANIFAYIACLGFPNLVIRSEANRGAGGSEADPDAVLFTANSVTLVAGALLAVIGYAASGWIVPSASDSAWTAFGLAMLLVVPIALQRHREAVLLGRNLGVLSLLPERLLRPLLMVVSIAALWFVAGVNVDASVAVGVQLLSYLACLAFLFLLVRWTRPHNGAVAKPRLGWPSADWGLIRQAAPLLLVGLTTLFATRLDIMMLAWLSNMTEVGTYRLASQIAAVVMMISTVAQALLHPRVARARAEKRLEALTAKLPMVGLALGISAVGLSLTLAVGFELVLHWLGDDYTAAYPPLLILLATYSVVAFLCPALSLLLMGGAPHLLATANVAALLLNGVLNSLLIPHLAGTGAAIATLTSLITLYILYAACALWNYRRRVADPSVFQT